MTPGTWNSLGQNTGVFSKYFPSSGDLPNPGIKPRSPTLQVDSLPAESQGKPKNTGVGRLSLLQWIFLTKESNRGLLHCRQILYQLSYQGSPTIVRPFIKSVLLQIKPLICHHSSRLRCNLCWKNKKEHEKSKGIYFMTIKS